MECGIRMDQVRTDGRPGTTNMVAAAREFIKRRTGILSLHGYNGNGKTTVMMAIVNECIEQGSEARYMTAASLTAYLRDAFKDGSRESDYDRLKELATVPVLAIDEFEKLRNSDYSREIQQELINERYRFRSSLGTVVAWNGSLDDLPWTSVRSRLTEGTIIQNKDSDLRPWLGDSK